MSCVSLSKSLELAREARHKGILENRSLYVRNLPLDILDIEIEEAFSYYGKVLDIHTWVHLSIRYAYIEMDHPNAATHAMDSLNKYELDGRNLIVSRRTKLRNSPHNGHGTSSRE